MPAGTPASGWRPSSAARQLPEDALPGRAPRIDGPPVARAWAEKDPVAARRLAQARAAITELGERLCVPAENLLTPDHLRRVLWTPPVTREPDEPGRPGR